MTYVPPPFPQPINPNLDSSGTVTADTPCRKCGYNLRGLHADGRCPECGSAVGLSVMGDLLRFSDPQWVRKLQRGVRLVLLGIVVIILGMIALIGLAIAVPALAKIAPVFSVAASLIGIVGAWFLTEPDPSGLGEDQYGTSRKIIRIALIVGLGNSVLSGIDQTTTLAPDLRLALAIIGGLAGLIGVVGQFAQLNYLSKLAMRIPDMALSARARFLMWAIGISYSVMLLAGIVVAIVVATTRGTGGGAAARSGGASGGMVAGGCVAGLAGLALLIFVLMYLRLLTNLGKRFGQEADVAEQTWAKAGA